MVRLEMIVNQALEREILKILPITQGDPHYTLIRNIEGSGYSGYCLGNQVWPEENLLFILYLEEQNRDQFLFRMNQLRKQFPQQGIALFEIPGIKKIIQEEPGESQDSNN